MLGQLLWLSGQTRPDLAAEVSLLAQRVARATVNDLAEINGCILRAKSLHVGIVLKRNTAKLKDSVAVAFGDAAFANAEGEKSQWGGVTALTHYPQKVWRGDYHLALTISWCSSIAKRVVRSTLAAEGCATSAALD